MQQDLLEILEAAAAEPSAGEPVVPIRLVTVKTPGRSTWRREELYDDDEVADRVFLDTNVLLAATDEGRHEHAPALAALDAWPAAGVTLYTSGQIRREYLCFATRPVQQNGLGLSLADALVNLRAFAGRLHFLEEDLRVAERLLAVIEAAPCSGKQVHDANVVATMLAHGIRTLVTMNIDDFARFAAQVTVTALEASRRLERGIASQPTGSLSRFPSPSAEKKRARSMST